MKLAVLILSLCLLGLLGLQSCAIYAGGQLISEQGLADSGAIGLFLAFCMLLGAAFVMHHPRISATVFGIGAVISFLEAQKGNYPDLQVWSVVVGCLMVLSLFGSRSKRKEIDKKDR